ncbi:MAG: S8 family peptidase [Planctomycetaceae bacterium]
MTRPEVRQKSPRIRFEMFEPRLALTAESVLEPVTAALQAAAYAQAATTTQSIEGHGWTEVAYARDEFGLRGAGQTVVVIDTGIAYDHKALGGGIGSGYHVVGGWDFAENDANPYDDGPAGYHGTHVGGIIGSQDSKYTGVAPGADLVSLRVFDDQGNCNLEWVEAALRWVHQHRNTYANPITTVNLSLGTDWNSNSIPGYANLESAFKQLEDDGIFISVSAGNSFAKYQTVGVSYPAASPYVVPVASIGSSGNLSSFSQRNDRVLAAPGEKIYSTLPSAFYGGNTAKNDWGAASGTSMAAPYVAGASVLVREAMKDLGQTIVTQDGIYDLLRNTADNVFDSVTKLTYKKLNLQRALDTLVGADDAGDSQATAKSIGAITQQTIVSGTIGRLSDKDFFQFTATATGKVTFTITDTGSLKSNWLTGSSGFTIEGNKLTLDTVAGQSYSFGLQTSDGIGRYSISTQIVAAQSPIIASTNLGTVTQTQITDTKATGDIWYQVVASRTGTFTAEAMFQNSKGNVDLEVYDAQRKLLGVSNGTGNAERIDFAVNAGSIYYVRMRGANADVDLRLTNLVTVRGNNVEVAGTAGNDNIVWTAGSQQAMTINGVSYTFAGTSRVTVSAGAGTDTVAIQGGGGAEQVTLRQNRAELSGANYSFSIDNAETVRIRGSQNDQVTFYDSEGNDTFEASPRTASMRGSNYSFTADGFGSVVAISMNGGTDTAKLYDSAGNDRLSGTASEVLLRGGNFSLSANGFSRTNVLATAGGYDTAALSLRSNRDAYTPGARSATLKTDRGILYFESFDAVTATASMATSTAAVGPVAIGRMSTESLVLTGNSVVTSAISPIGPLGFTALGASPDTARPASVVSEKVSIADLQVAMEQELSNLKARREASEEHSALDDWFESLGT